MENNKDIKLRIVRSKCLADALVWLGFEYKKDNENNFVFKRTYEFELAWDDLHALRVRYYKGHRDTLDEVIKSRRDWQGYKNEVTDYLDKYLLKCDDCADFYESYIYPISCRNIWSIRVPGATRGHLEIVDGVIKDIEIYKDSLCYSEEVFDNLKQFIGRNIDLF